jgi:hypothetical protein
MASDALSQTRRSSRQIPIGNSDKNGFARLDIPLYQIENSGKTLDIYLKFSSNPEKDISYLGRFWSIPFFESNLIETDKDKYTWKSPNYGEYNFVKDKKLSTTVNSVYSLRGTGSWILEIPQKKEAIIKNAKNDAVYYKFKSGYLHEFRTAPDSSVLRIKYDGKLNPLGLRDVSSGKDILIISYTDSRISKISKVDDKADIQFGYDVFPINNRDLRKEKFSLLSKVAFTFNSELIEITYRDAGKVNRQMLDNDYSKASEVSCLANEIFYSFGEKRQKQFIRWDASTGISIEDSSGKYAVYNPYYDPLNSEYSNTQILSDRKRKRGSTHTAVSYLKEGDKYDGLYAYNKRSAIRTSRDPQTGEYTRRSYIGGSGLSFMKIRKVEKRSADASKWTAVYSRIYDNNGNPLRDISDNGSITEYVRDSNGKLLRLLRNGELVQQNDYKDGNLSKLTYISNGIKKEENYESKTGKLLTFFENGNLIQENVYDKEGRLKLEKYSDSETRYYYKDKDFYEVSLYKDKTWVIAKKLQTAMGSKIIWSKWSDGLEVLYDTSMKEIQRGISKNLIHDEFLNLILSNE